MKQMRRAVEKISEKKDPEVNPTVTVTRFLTRKPKAYMGGKINGAGKTGHPHVED
jgi:hypothetical protein